jgi:uncharacterized protein
LLLQPTDFSNLLITLQKAVLFEYDSGKSQGNKSKHGIDFDEAQLLWNDVFRVEIQAQSTTEPRFIIIGKVWNKHWSAIVTYRDESIRIISVRRSRENEVNLYES